ncbi:MAG TPA: hypothetical protein VJ986_01300 [Gaiellaceae bacterium]|nr:hypothetical protein [Gaiellaceae bacterium]
MHLRIPTKSEYVTLCRLVPAGLAPLRGRSDETLADVKLAVTGAVAHAVCRAGDADSHVEVTDALAAERLEIEVAGELETDARPGAGSRLHVSKGLSSL